MVPRKFQNKIPENKVPDKSASFLWFHFLIFGFSIVFWVIYSIKSLTMEFVGKAPSAPCEPGPAQGFSLLARTLLLVWKSTCGFL